jgi:hypothetical protein
MPSRRQNQTKMTVAEERKKRQEKFRKRSGSLFDKVKKLALDTDAFVALVVRDRAGRVRSFRSSDSLYWPYSIIDLIVSGNISTYMMLTNTKRRNILQVLTSTSRSMLSPAAGKGWKVPF